LAAVADKRAMRMARNERLKVVAGTAFAALLALLALVLPAAASGGARASIVSGKAATSEQWPWAAFILATDRHGDGFSCTGSVVAPTLVLTAGHCVEDIITAEPTPVGRYLVVTGSTDVRDSSLRQVLRVRKTILYPGFNRFKVHGDAALLVLRQPTTAPSVALAGPTDAALLNPNTPLAIAGWGLSGPLNHLKRTPVLRQGWAFVQRQLYCRNHARIYYPFFNYGLQLCTVTPPSFAVGTCHGDSGGPAVAFREDGTPVQIGITSLGAADCNTRLPDIFTRVDRIYDWATAQIAVATGTPPVATATEG